MGASDRKLSCAPVRSNVLRDHDDNGLIVWYSYLEEVLPINSGFRISLQIQAFWTCSVFATNSAFLVMLSRSGLDTVLD